MKECFGKYCLKMIAILSGVAKGDHDIWYSPKTNLNITVDGKIKSRHTANAILKQSGIEYKF